VFIFLAFYRGARRFHEDRKRRALRQEAEEQLLGHDEEIPSKLRVSGNSSYIEGRLTILAGVRTTQRLVICATDRSGDASSSSVG
jgi:hypothetical protein